MTKLECKVNSCAHYNAGCCGLSSIHVAGETASVSNQTCCASYCEKSMAGPFNKAGSQSGISQQISCDARRCQYNSQGSCSASSVCVGACCGEVTSQKETECCTFCCK